MTCHKLNNSHFITRRWHRLWCPECRHAQHLDTMIGFGLMQMKSEPFAAAGMESALSALNMQVGGRNVRHASRQLANRWLRRQARMAGVALILGGVWWQYMNYIPPIAIPARTAPQQNAFDYFKLAGSMVSATKGFGDEVAEAQQLPNDPPTRERRDARLKREGKPVQTLAQLMRAGQRENLAITYDGHPLSYQELRPDFVYAGQKIRMSYTLEEKQKLLDDNRLALTILREGLKHPYMDVYVRRFDAMFPHFSDFRQMARLLHLEADVKAARGDWNGAMQSSLDAMQLGTDVEHGGPLIGRLVGIACEAIGREQAWKAVEHLDAAQAKAAAARLQAIRANHAPFVESMQEESWNMQEGLRDQMQKPGWRFNMGLWTGSSDSKAFSIAMLGWSNRVILKDIAQAMDENIRRSRLPYAQSGKLPEMKAPFDPIAQILFPVFAQAQYKDVYGSETQSALLLTTLALRAYQLEHGGQLPDRLEQLTPRYLKQVPADPFSADARTPLRYSAAMSRLGVEQADSPARQAVSKPDAGQEHSKPGIARLVPYVLYSIGPDDRDDGGDPADALRNKPGASWDEYGNKIKPNDKNRFAVQPTSQGDIVAGVNTR